MEVLTAVYVYTYREVIIKNIFPMIFSPYGLHWFDCIYTLDASK